MGLHRTSGFFGREAEALRARERLDDAARLLTITGPPGIGKTRLALELLEGWREDAYEVLVCDLASCVEPDEVVPSIARALGASAAPRGTDPVVTVLEERGPTLVLLDNAEQVAGALAVHLAGWLERCPDARWLVTSQWRLDLGEEHVLELPPLTRADSEALWIDRVRRARPDYELESERAAVDTLLADLDFLPLAIELAASRRHLLTAHAMHERLDKAGLAFLESRQRDRPERHRTLERAIEWAWDLLEPAEQHLLAQCSVFETDFTLSALEGVAELPPDDPSIVDLLQALRDKSMVQLRDPTLVGHAEGAPRYALSTSVRAFASARITDRPRILRRHAEQTVDNAEALVERRFRLEDPPAHLELAAELANLRAVVDRSLSEPSVDRELGVRALACAFQALRSSGTTSSLAPLATKLSAGAGELQSAVSAKLCEVRGLIAWLGGDFANAERELREATTLATGSDLAQVLSLLAYVCFVRGEGGENELIERAIAVAREHGDALSEAVALEMAGEWGTQKVDAAEGRAMLERAIELFRASGNDGRSAAALARLGRAHLALGQTRSARELFMRSLELRQRTGIAWGVAYATYGLASVELDEGSFDRAIALYERAIVALRAAGDVRMLGGVQAALGLAYRAIGKLASAAEELHAGTERLRRCGDRRYTALYDSALRAVSSELGAEPPVHAREPALPADDPFEEARRLHELRPTATAEQAREIASSKLLKELAARSFEVRQALRLILARGRTSARRELVVGPDATWIVLSGERIEIGNRPLLQRLMRFLLECHARAPDRGASVDEVFAAVWPDERVVASAGANRVYAAFATLRRLGLGDAILRDQAGYHLDPTLDVRMSE